MDFELSSYDVENIIADGMRPTFTTVKASQLARRHAGDFSSIIDFSRFDRMSMTSRSRSHGRTRNNEFTYLDAMYGDEIEAIRTCH